MLSKLWSGYFHNAALRKAENREIGYKNRKCKKGSVSSPMTTFCGNKLHETTTFFRSLLSLSHSRYSAVYLTHRFSAKITRNKHSDRSLNKKPSLFWVRKSQYTIAHLVS
jgi:hypothetical protein